MIKDENAIANKAEKVELSVLNDQMITEVTEQFTSKNGGFSVPISGLAALGAGVSELIPAFHTITQTVATEASGLYRIVNAGVGDVLKAAKDGNNWGALKNTLTGKSTMAKLQEVGTQTITNTTVVPPDPAIVMMAVALYQIDRKLDEIKEMQAQILSFLENEKESQIQADIHTLSDIITRFKFSWDNALFISANYKEVIEIKNRAQGSIISYRKWLLNSLNKDHGLIVKSKVQEVLSLIQKNFVFYRLSLYIYAESCFLDIVLSENYRKSSIEHAINDIESQQNDYIKTYELFETFLRELSSNAFEAIAGKGIGIVEGEIGAAINKLPFIKDTNFGLMLEGAGEINKYRATKLERDVIKEFSDLKDPRVNVFTEKLTDMEKIFNNSCDIYIDNNNLYLTTAE